MVVRLQFFFTPAAEMLHICNTWCPILVVLQIKSIFFAYRAKRFFWPKKWLCLIIGHLLEMHVRCHGHYYFCKGCWSTRLLDAFACESVLCPVRCAVSCRMGLSGALHVVRSARSMTGGQRVRPGPPSWGDFSRARHAASSALSRARRRGRTCLSASLPRVGLVRLRQEGHASLPQRRLARGDPSARLVRSRQPGACLPPHPRGFISMRTQHIL